LVFGYLGIWGFAYLMVIKMETLIAAYKIKTTTDVLRGTFRLVAGSLRGLVPLSRRK
jgi:hypothetical protein